MLRDGEKGEGKFERITWDEAMDRIADTLHGIKKEYGPEAVMSYFGRGCFELNLGDVFGHGLQYPGQLRIPFPFWVTQCLLAFPRFATCLTVFFASVPP